jgi:hypothetical protein
VTREYVPIDISNASDLKRLVEAVRLSGKTHALQEGAETAAVIRPVAKKEATRSRRSGQRRRSRVFTKDDPLWSIVGMFKADDGPPDVADNVDTYLAEAYLDTHA